MIDRHRILRVNGLALHVHEWGTDGAPVMLAVPGTALVTELFSGLVELLGDEWHGYTLDRRAHGLSDKPATGYDFIDFAADLVGVIDALGLQGAFGVGHSAGGTDMLLAAAARQGAFGRMVIIEPTVQDAHRPPLPASPGDGHPRIDTARRRRTEFPSFDAVFEHWSTREPYSRVRPDLLHQYIRGAFVAVEDGTVRLRSNFEHEFQMLVPILRVMDHTYVPPPGRADPFALIPMVEAPVTLVTMGQSGPTYGPMADIAATLLPNVSRVHLPENGHLLPLEAPEVLAAIIDLASDDTAAATRASG